MVDEHFGINVVEFMVRQSVPLTHPQTSDLIAS
jgi:hypothetical protein